MTDQDAIEAIRRDAAVIQANTSFVKGVPTSPTITQLESVASVSLRLALSEVVLDPSNARKLFADEFTLTATNGTDEYTMPNYVGRVISIRRTSDDEPLQAFDDLKYFDRWFAARYGGVSISTSAAPVGYYPSGRDNDGVPQITFVPGIGDETSLKVRYERALQSGMSLNLIPVSFHDGIVLGGINFASGGKYAKQWQRMKRTIMAGLDLVIGGPGEIQKSERVRRTIRRYNSAVSSSSAYWPASVKTLD